MDCGYIPMEPPGLNSPIGKDRRPIYTLTGGDDVLLNTDISLPSGVSATPDNSTLELTVRDRRFGPVVWDAGWGDNVYLQDAPYSDVIEIHIPAEETEQWRRGSYIASVRITDLDTGFKRTAMTFYLTVEYAPTSPHRDVAYCTPLPAV